MQALPTLAILGGTGALGTGLAMRWADAGYPIVIGSRSREKAQAAASTIAARGGAAAVTGDDNAGAARTGNVVVIAVPWATHDAILSEIKSLVSGKIVVDAVVPLVPPKVSVVQLPPAGSAGVIAHNTLGEGAKVVSAFHNVAAAKLQSGAEIDCDVLVFGNDREARDAVIELAKALGTRGVDGGPIANSAAAEALTAVLIGINRRYKVPGAGIRITGL
jgi:NADPH-dependent F420 reductase